MVNNFKNINYIIFLSRIHTDLGSFFDLHIIFKSYLLYLFKYSKSPQKKLRIVGPVVSTNKNLDKFITKNLNLLKKLPGRQSTNLIFSMIFYILSNTKNMTQKWCAGQKTTLNHYKSVKGICSQRLRIKNAPFFLINEVISFII